MDSGQDTPISTDPDARHTPDPDARTNAMTSADAAPTRVLITGANGFVGRHLIAHLLGIEHGRNGEQATTGSVDAADQNAAAVPPAPAPRFEIYAACLPAQVEDARRETGAAFDAAGWVGGGANGRIRVLGLELDDAAGLARLVGDLAPHHIYHLAARSSGADADREAVFRANVGGTRNLLEAASALRPFPRVLLASTGYVYGDTDASRPAVESDPIGPLWRYGAYADSKIEMETVARAYRGFAVTARAFAHTGPGQLPQFAVPAFAHQIARMERGLEPPILQVGNLDAWRDLLDVRDVVRAYALLMARPAWDGVAGHAFNVASGQPVQIRDVVNRLCALSAAHPQVVIDPARLRALDIACSTGDPARLGAATGWQPTYTLDDTLRDMLDYLREKR